ESRGCGDCRGTPLDSDRRREPAFFCAPCSGVEAMTGSARSVPTPHSKGSMLVSALPRFHSGSDVHAKERTNLSCGIEAQHESGHVQLHVKALPPFSFHPSQKFG